MKVSPQLKAFKRRLEEGEDSEGKTRVCFSYVDVFTTHEDLQLADVSLLQERIS